MPQKTLWINAFALVVTIGIGHGTPNHPYATNNDPCQCSSGWQVNNPVQVIRTTPLGRHSHENPHCDRSLLIPEECGFMRIRIIGEWSCGEGGASQRCDNISWSLTGSDENYPVCFPSEGLGPCSGVMHVFLSRQITTKQIAQCSDTGACRERIQIDIIPERYSIWYIVPDCPCEPIPKQPVVIEII